MHAPCSSALRPSWQCSSRRQARHQPQRCGAQNDPFRSSAATPSGFAAGAAGAPAGFLAPGVSPDSLVQVSEADTLLRRFDTDCMAAQRAGKLAGGSTPPVLATAAASPALKAACVSLAARAGSVMLGLCAEDAAGGVDALKAWTTALGLPRRLLHGMDTNGVANTIQGSVFIKYNSASGDAFLSGYAGDSRGVLFTPGLPDGVFRQFGYLPLSLMDSRQAQ